MYPRDVYVPAAWHEEMCESIFETRENQPLTDRKNIDLLSAHIAWNTKMTPEDKNRAGQTMLHLGWKNAAK